MEEINKHEKNTASLTSPVGTNKYLADIVVKQLERTGTATGDILTGYKLWGCFPTNISQIDLSYNNENEIEEFSVDLQVQWWEAKTGTNASDIV